MFIITDQTKDFKIAPQYSTVKELAHDPNRISLPTPKSSIRVAADQLAKARAEKAWKNFFDNGGTL